MYTDQHKSKFAYQMDPPDLLALTLDCDWSRTDLDKAKANTDSLGTSVFPNHNKLLDAKNEIVTLEEIRENAEISSTKVVLPVEYLAKQTLERVLGLERVKNRLVELSVDPEEIVEGTFMAKEGYDGFQTRTCYKQLGEDGQKVDDHDFAAADLIALNLSVKLKDGRNEIIWTNCLCNSAYACRPVR